MKVQFFIRRHSAGGGANYLFSECANCDGTESDIEQQFVGWIEQMSQTGDCVPGTEYWEPVSRGETKSE